MCRWATTSARFQLDPFRYMRRSTTTGFRFRGCTSLESRTIWPGPIILESLGPGLLDNAKVWEFWDETTLTPAEEIVIDALRLVVGGELERIAVVGDRSRSNRSQGRRAVARLKDSSRHLFH